MAKQNVGADTTRDNILAFQPRPRPLRADVPPFDPGNPAHLRAWETMWDLGRAELRWAEEAL